MPRLNVKNNAKTALSAGINSSATSFNVDDGSLLPDAPFRITAENEIMEVGARGGNALSDITRGIEGTTAAAHGAGAYVEVRFTAGVYSELETATGAQAKANTAETNANDYAEGMFDDLAGDGRTTETVKDLADALTAHKTDCVPHQFSDGEKIYQYGFSADPLTGVVYFNYEEVE